MLNKRETDETKQIKGKRMEGRGWKRREIRIKGWKDVKGVDWVLLKLIPFQQEAGLPDPQLEAAVASTVILIFTNCPINTVIKLMDPPLCPHLHSPQRRCLLPFEGTDLMVEVLLH